MNNFIYKTKKEKLSTVFFYDYLEINNEKDILNYSIDTNGFLKNKIKLNEDLFICILKGFLVLRVHYINTENIISIKKFQKDFFEEIEINRAYFIKPNLKFEFKIKDFFYKLVSKNKIFFSICIEINFF